ncbi:protein of unknown function [Burkholderia multivorans]
MTGIDRNLGKFANLLATYKPLNHFILKLLAKFGGAGGAFPYDQDAPPEGFQCIKLATIPLAIRGELLAPEFAIRGGHRRKSTALMDMPEAAMDKNCRPILGQDEIRRAWQISSMQTVAETRSMQHSANHQLRLGMSASYSRHHLATFHRIDSIGHATAPWAPHIEEALTN